MALCEMCGKESRLVNAKIEGGELNVCSVCVKYGTVKGKSSVSRNFVSKGSFSRPLQKKDEDFRIVRNYSSLIRSARESKDMGQEDFSKFLNERESIVSKWENGTLRPRIGIAIRLEKMLGIKLIEKDIKKPIEMESSKKINDEFTLGDFIKVRKRK